MTEASQPLHDRRSTDRRVCKRSGSSTDNRVDTLEGVVNTLENMITLLETEQQALLDTQTSLSDKLADLKTMLESLRTEYKSHVDLAFPAGNYRKHGDEHASLTKKTEWLDKLKWQMWQATVNLVWPAIIIAILVGLWTYAHPDRITSVVGNTVITTTPLPGKKP